MSDTMLAVKERPILFSAPMVRAILAGVQTQTRRAVKPQPPEDSGRIYVGEYHPTVVDRNGDEQPGAPIFGAYNEDGSWGVRCPYGAPGDRLWVREAWGWCRKNGGHVVFAAEGDGWETCHPGNPNTGAAAPYRWRPSIHMPRWASRITLEITGVRVERVQDISEADARAEGVERGAWPEDCTEDDVALNDECGYFPPVSHAAGFATLWDSINAKRGHGWDVNPWVWVVEFRRIEAQANAESAAPAPALIFGHDGTTGGNDDPA